MRARSAYFILLAILFSFSPRAHAAVSVIGTPQAVECFQKAEIGSTDTRACDEALKDPDLLDRDRASTLVNRGIIYNNAHKVESALADFAAALAIDPNIAEAYLNRGNSKFFQGKLDAAIADFTRAIDLKIDRIAAAYYNRALAYAAEGRFEEAQADLELALAADPSLKQAKDQLAAINRILARERQAAPPAPPEAPAPAQ